MRTVKRIEFGDTFVINDDKGNTLAETYTEQDARQIEALPELMKLAERVAALDHTAGGIDAATLASLVYDAHVAIRRTM